MEHQKYYIISIWRDKINTEFPQLSIEIYETYEEMMEQYNKSINHWFNNSDREAFGDDRQAFEYAKKLIRDNDLEWVNDTPYRGESSLENIFF